MSLPPSDEYARFGHQHYSPNQGLYTPNQLNQDMISDASSEFPYSQPNNRDFSNNFGSMTDTHYSASSFSFPNSIFTNQEEFSLYEQFNKGEK